MSLRSYWSMRAAVDALKQNAHIFVRDIKADARHAFIVQFMEANAQAASTDLKLCHVRMTDIPSVTAWQQVVPDDWVCTSCAQRLAYLQELHREDVI